MDNFKIINLPNIKLNLTCFLEDYVFFFICNYPYQKDHSKTTLISSFLMFGLKSNPQTFIY